MYLPDARPSLRPIGYQDTGAEHRVGEYRRLFLNAMVVDGTSRPTRAGKVKAKAIGVAW